MKALKIIVIASILAIAGCTSKSACTDNVDGSITQVVNELSYDPTVRSALFKVAKVTDAEKTELGSVKCTAFLSMNGFQPKTVENSIKIEYEVSDSSVSIPGHVLDGIPVMLQSAVAEFKLDPYTELDLTKEEKLILAQRWDDNFIAMRKSTSPGFVEDEEACSHAAEAMVTDKWGSIMNSCQLPAIF